MSWLGRAARSAFADREGVTSLEYAAIAAGLLTAVAASYALLSNHLAAYLERISFPG